MENIFKYRHFYGLDFDESPRSDAPDKQRLLIYADETAFKMDSGFSNQDNYPVFSVLWACRHIHHYGTLFGRSIWQSVVDFVDEIKSGGLAIPLLWKNIRHFQLLEFLKESLEPYKQELLEARENLKPVIYGIKKTYKRIDRKSLILILMLSSATAYLLWRTNAYIRHSRKGELNIKDKVVLITGANSGIGERLAYEFIERGAYVILVGSDLTRTLQVVDNIRRHMATRNGTANFTYDDPNKNHFDYFPEPEEYMQPVPHGQPREPNYVNKLQWIHIDLGNIQTIWRGVYQIFESFDHIDILINNAAVSIPDYNACYTFDGMEANFGINYVGHFVLTNSIIGYMEFPLKRPCKIINVLCEKAFCEGWIPFEQIEMLTNSEGLLANPYSTSKFCNFLFHRELTKRLQLCGIKDIHTYAVCPPECETNLGRYYETTTFENWIPRLSTEAGMQAILHCSLSPDCSDETGLYYENCDISTPPFPCGQIAKEIDKMCARLWDLTLEKTKKIICQLQAKDKPLPRGSFYGEAVFRPLSDNENGQCRSYRPQVARQVLNFRNDYTPIFLNQEFVRKWRKRMCEKDVHTLWEELHGPLTLQTRQPVRDSGDVYDPIYDRPPVVTSTKNKWMY